MNNDCPKIDVICANCAHEVSSRGPSRFFNYCNKQGTEVARHFWCSDWKCRASAHLDAINQYNREKGLIK